MLFEVHSFVKGYHAHMDMDIWTPVQGEMLLVSGNCKDQNDDCGGCFI